MEATRCHTIHRIRFFFRPTGEEAKHTKRPRFKVYCEECSATVHPNTVAPEVWAKSHYRHAHDHGFMRGLGDI